jgi:hypothetical protein
VSGFNAFRAVNSLTTRRLLAKRQRVVDGVKIFLDIAKESSDWFGPLKSALGCVNALIKHYEVFVQWITVAHNSHKRSQQFEDVKEKIEDLVPHLNRFKQNADAAMADGDQAEKNRLLELSRYASPSLATLSIANGLRSALGKIEKRSQELLAKGTAARFIDKGADSGEVARLLEQLREAVIHYQVSENGIVGRAPLTWKNRYRNNERSTTKSLPLL